MNFGRKLKKLREKKEITQQELANLLKVGRSTIAGYETKNKQPDYDKLQKLANYFNVSIDYLIGESASSIIEDKLEELEMTLEELAKKSGVPLAFFKNLDEIVPDFEIDLGEQCYTYITTIAWILGIPCSRLRLAFARQEIPSNQYPNCTSTAKEDFNQPTTPEATIENVIHDDPELLSFFQELKKRDDLQLMFKQTKDLSPDSIKRIIRYVKMVEDEEKT
ncbi:MAG: helix-turn-helix transcriptional regulator [Clostridia bacterium]|nr:helix-turn-helix transcriptional regulator [Clostridia bacterium]